MQSRLKLALIFIAACAISAGASAHIGVNDLAHVGFIVGFLHPLSGLDHLAAMVSVGVWSAMTARRESYELLWGPVGFAYMLLVGAVLGQQGVSLAAGEPMIAASLLVTGLLVVSRLRVPGIGAAVLVGVFAVFHGLAHGYELAGSPDATQTLVGMLTATVLLHVAGLGLGWVLRSTNVWVGRAAGVAVAVQGMALLGQMA